MKNERRTATTVVGIAKTAIMVRVFMLALSLRVSAAISVDFWAMDFMTMFSSIERLAACSLTRW